MSLAPGSVLHFSAKCPLPPLTGSTVTIDGVRTYQFGGDVTVSYTLSARDGGHYQLTIAEDALGFYLGISRLLSAQEEDAFFGRDALNFFKEESSAKSIRCKADPVIEQAWTAPRYIKTVDWIEGAVLEGRFSTAGAGRQTVAFRYNLLADEPGERALEIEHYGAGESMVYLTVYRPAEDIEQISEPLPNIPEPMPMAMAGALKERTQPAQPKAVEPHLFEQPRPRTDFRKMEMPQEIHIGRSPSADRPLEPMPTVPPLPSFLLSRENSYMSLDEILTPETERMRCDLNSAKILIDTALKRHVHVSEIMRDLLGLEARMPDEAVFELPLSDKDYHMLAQRYRLRPDRKMEIRACLQEELRLKLLSIAKN